MVKIFPRATAALIMLLLGAPSGRSQELPVADVDTVNTVYLHSGAHHGGYRRAMDPTSQLATGVHGNGTSHLGAWSVHGHFDYRRQSRRGVYFAGVATPYDASSYIWGDSLSGNWQDDVIHTGAGLESPWFGRHRLAVDVQYGTAIGVRTEDPKPYYRLRDATIAAGYHFRLGEQGHELRFHPAYRHVFEENEIGYGTAGNSYIIRSRGYGSVLEGSVVSMDRRRTGHHWSLRAGLVYPDRWQLWATAWVGRERVSEGIGHPVPDGSYRIAGISLQAAYRLRRFTPELDIQFRRGTGESFLSRSVDGDYAHYPVENAFMDHLDMQFTLAYRPTHRLWKQFAASVSMENDQRDDILHGSCYQYTNVHAGTRASAVWRRIPLDVHLGYRLPLQGLEEGGPPSRLRESLFGHDYRYHRMAAADWSARAKIPLAVSMGGHLWWVAARQEGVATAHGFRFVHSVALGIDFSPPH